jgi:hypothetical protein
MLSTIAEIVRDFLIFVAVMTGMLVVLVVTVSKLPDTNPLKRLLTALTYRLGATAAAGVFAVPVQPVPGLDGAYDIVVPLLLLWYWFTFFRDVCFRGGWRPSPAPTSSAPRGPVIEHDPRR